MIALAENLLKKFPAFYVTRSYINAFTSAPTVSVLRKIKPVHAFASHFLKTHFNYPPIYALVFQVVSFPSGFATKTLYASLFYHLCTSLNTVENFELETKKKKSMVAYFNEASGTILYFV